MVLVLVLTLVFVAGASFSIQAVAAAFLPPAEHSCGGG
jgi:hypothetical protein